MGANIYGKGDEEKGGVARNDEFRDSGSDVACTIAPELSACTPSGIQPKQ